jgi:AAHS family 4-hydroxybenzoate transporter-like MFS transporter
MAFDRAAPEHRASRDAGPVADCSRQPMILASVALFQAATLVIACTSNVTELIIARVVPDLVIGAALPNIIAFTGEYSPQRLRARLIV